MGTVAGQTGSFVNERRYQIRNINEDIESE